MVFQTMCKARARDFSLMDAFGAGENIWGGGSPTAHSCNSSLLEGFGSSADLYLKLLSSWLCSILCSLPSPEDWRGSYYKDQETMPPVLRNLAIKLRLLHPVFKGAFDNPCPSEDRTTNQAQDNHCYKVVPTTASKKTIKDFFLPSSLSLLMYSKKK